MSFPEEEKLSEYILNDSGCIFSGNYRQISATPWFFGQVNSKVSITLGIEIFHYITNISGPNQVFPRVVMFVQHAENHPFWEYRLKLDTDQPKLKALFLRSLREKILKREISRRKLREISPKFAQGIVLSAKSRESRGGILETFTEKL